MSVTKGPRFIDTPDRDLVESRRYEVGRRREAVGKTTIEIRCPFCERTTDVYVWSLSGGGKRCGCGALFGSTGFAYHWAVPSDTTGEQA